MEITIPVDIVAIVKRLPLRIKLELVRQLEQETWAERLEQVVNRIRTRRAVKRLSTGEINRIVEDVRKNRYARASTRRS